MANRIKLNICGVSCVLITDESEAYMSQLGKEAEALITQLMRASGSLPVAAVTAALSYLDELKKASGGETDALKQKIAALSEINEELRKENRLLKEKAPAPPAHKDAGYQNPLRRADLEKDGMITFYAKEQ